MYFSSGNAFTSNIFSCIEFFQINWGTIHIWSALIVSECIIWLQEFRRGSSSYFLGINCIIGKFKYKDQYIYLDFKIYVVGNFAYC